MNNKKPGIKHDQLIVHIHLEYEKLLLMKHMYQEKQEIDVSSKA